ncbi:MAG: hypothetical protein M1503_02860 [Thaumarchaeota archaeon]|nr:hypothetical protein [Nitrososphaerota archaeon]MCL5317192.1 hypothetical protein [Nitrososphaerota archaeon]
MSSFPGSPKLSKGALISYDPLGFIPQVVIFQYNPETLTRKLEAQRTQRSGSPVETYRLKGPPVEKIELKVELDAADQLEKPEQNATTVAMGIYPQLSALEMMIYPKSSWVIAKTALAAGGAIEIAPPEEPFTLFVWGVNRVVPVRIASFSIVEQSYDPNLNPITADVSLTLEVLTYEDFKMSHPGYSIFLAHQVVKETMAAVGSITNTASLGGVRVP